MEIEVFIWGIFVGAGGIVLIGFLALLIFGGNWRPY